MGPTRVNRKLPNECFESGEEHIKGYGKVTQNTEIFSTKYGNNISEVGSPDTHGCPSLTHWGRVTHICVGKLTIIGSGNGLSPECRQAIIWTNVGILLIGPLGTNFSEILIEIQTFSLKNIRLKMSSAKCCSFRLGLNVLMDLDNLSAVCSRTDVIIK